MGEPTTVQGGFLTLIAGIGAGAAVCRGDRDAGSGEGRIDVVLDQVLAEDQRLEFVEAAHSR